MCPDFINQKIKMIKAQLIVAVTLLMPAFSVNLNLTERCFEKSEIFTSTESSKNSTQNHLLAFYLTNKTGADNDLSEYIEYFPGHLQTEPSFAVLQSNSESMSSVLSVLDRLDSLNRVNLDSSRSKDHSSRPVNNPKFDFVVPQVSGDICIFEKRQGPQNLAGELKNDESFYLIVQMENSLKSLADHFDSETFWQELETAKARITLYSEMLYKLHVIHSRGLKYCKLSPNSLFFDPIRQDLRFSHIVSLRPESEACFESPKSARLRVSALNVDWETHPFRFEAFSLALTLIQLELRFFDSQGVSVQNAFGDLSTLLNPRGTEVELDFPSGDAIGIWSFLQGLFDRVDYLEENVHLAWNLQPVRGQLERLIDGVLRLAKTHSHKLLAGTKAEAENYQLFWELLRKLIREPRNFVRRPKVMEMYLNTQILLDRLDIDESKFKKREFSLLK